MSDTPTGKVTHIGPSLVGPSLVGPSLGGPSHVGPGHNSRDLVVEIEVRFFNALTRFAAAGETRRKMQVPVGTTVGELARDLAIPKDKIFLALVNGRDITPGLVGAPLRESHLLEAGDVVAFSGAVPYSYGYGAPVV